LVVPTVDMWGLQMEILTIAELDWQYLVMMLGCQLGSKYLVVPTVNVWVLQWLYMLKLLVSLNCSLLDIYQSCCHTNEIKSHGKASKNKKNWWWEYFFEVNSMVWLVRVFRFEVISMKYLMDTFFIHDFGKWDMKEQNSMVYLDGGRWKRWYLMENDSKIYFSTHIYNFAVELARIEWRWEKVVLVFYGKWLKDILRHSHKTAVEWASYIWFQTHTPSTVEIPGEKRWYFTGSHHNHKKNLNTTYAYTTCNNRSSGPSEKYNHMKSNNIPRYIFT
jgi:hypothetical protein